MSTEKEVTTLPENSEKNVCEPSQAESNNSSTAKKTTRKSKSADKTVIEDKKAEEKKQEETKQADKKAEDEVQENICSSTKEADSEQSDVVHQDSATDENNEQSCQDLQPAKSCEGQLKYATPLYLGKSTISPVLGYASGYCVVREVQGDWTKITVGISGEGAVTGYVQSNRVVTVK